MIELRTERLRAQILPRGATLAGIWVEDLPNSLVLGSDDAAVYSGPLVYSGAVVGPIANRVRNAEVTLSHQTWSLPANEGTTCLHGGPAGLHQRHWQVEDRSDTEVTLRTDVAHKDLGLPGNLVVRAMYRLEHDCALRLELTARSDRDTLINLAHHPYWRLDSRPTVAEHSLQVFAEAYLPVDSDTLPTGAVVPVAGTPYDFRTSRPVPTHRIIDENFCLANTRHDAPRPAAILTVRDGVRLQIDTTEAGLQVYNGANLPDDEAPLHPGQTLRPYAAIALEPQGWPDAPHHPNFPSIALSADDTYSQTTIYRFFR